MNGMNTDTGNDAVLRAATDGTGDLNRDSHRLRATLPGFTGHDLDPMTAPYFAPFRYYSPNGVRDR